MPATRVLFMCLSNDARSPMAEAWLKGLYGQLFDVQSAGLEPMPIDPRAVQTMHEVGLDLRTHTPRRVFDLFRADELFSYPVTLWDTARHERRAFYPGFCIRLFWEIPDPVHRVPSGTDPLEPFREVRDLIKRKILEWVERLLPEAQRCKGHNSVHDFVEANRFSQILDPGSRESM